MPQKAAQVKFTVACTVLQGVIAVLFGFLVRLVWEASVNPLQTSELTFVLDRPSSMYFVQICTVCRLGAHRKQNQEPRVGGRVRPVPKYDQHAFSIVTILIY